MGYQRKRVEELDDPRLKFEISTIIPREVRGIAQDIFIVKYCIGKRIKCGNMPALVFNLSAATLCTINFRDFSNNEVLLELNI